MTDAKTPAQVDRFREAARETDADETEDRFKARLRKIAKAKDGRPRPPKGGKGDR